MKKLKEKDMKDETKETQEEELRQTIYTSVILQTHALMRTHTDTHSHTHTHHPHVVVLVAVTTSASKGTNEKRMQNIKRT